MANIVKAEEFKNIIEGVRLLFPHLAEVEDEEIVKAVGVAKRLGLDPIKKEVHFVPFNQGGKKTLQLVVNYLEYVKRAGNLLNGYKTEIGKDSIGIYSKCTIYRKDWDHPFEWITYLDEAKRETKSWKEMPLFMLRKTNIAQAFRMCFPESVADLPYEESEIFTDAITVQPEPVKEEPAKEDKKITDKQRKRLWAIAKQHNVSEAEVKDIIKKYGYESTADITVEDYDSIIAEIEAQAEKEPDWSEYEEQS